MTKVQLGGSIKKKNGHKENCKCPICVNMKFAKGGAGLIDEDEDIEEASTKSFSNDDENDICTSDSNNNNDNDDNNDNSSENVYDEEIICQACTSSDDFLKKVEKLDRKRSSISDLDIHDTEDDDEVIS